MAGLPRMNRVAPGGMVFHVLNRGVGRMRLFRSDADYVAFKNILEETLAVQPLRICAYRPVPVPSRWANLVNEVQTEAELRTLRQCVHRGQPFGSESGIARCVRKLGLESTIRPRVRPKIVR